MTTRLNMLMSAPEPMFGIVLRELEAMTGHKSVDVAYFADILHRSHTLMRSIGLDPADTTARELYAALAANSGDESLFRSTHDVGVLYSDGIVSCNIDDVRQNVAKKFEDRTVLAMRRAIRDKFVWHYEKAANDNERVAAIVSQVGLQKEPPEDAAEVLKQSKKTIKIKVDGETTMPNILCVGDIISDAFIKLSEDYAEVTTDDKGYQRVSFELGAKLPYDDVQIVKAVECSPNAAVSISRLGLNAQLMSWIGDDSVGEEMVEYLKEQNVDTTPMVVEPGMRSIYHYVLR